jgi:hypothetical protein
METATQGEGESCCRKAVEIARRQQAKSLELRAAMSLARLWRQQGKKTEAHKLLSDVDNWFTEGLIRRTWGVGAFFEKSYAKDDVRTCLASIFLNKLGFRL